MPPDTAERRPPGKESGAHNGAGSNVSTMLQRRYAAALRLPPLACGCRDPLWCDLRGSCLPVIRDTWCCPGEFDARGRLREHCGCAS